MYQEVLTRRNAYRVLGGVVVAAGFLSLGLLPAEAATQSQYTVLKSQLESAQLMLAQIQPVGAVRGASTTASVAVPVRPVCRITFDKPLYKLGETIKVSWTTTGTKSAEFVADTSGKDTLPLPTGTTLATKGSATVVANITGSPAVFMKVTSTTGHEMTCGRSITIVDGAAGQRDSRIAALQTKLINLVAQANKLQEQIAALNEKNAENMIAQLQTQIQIEQLMNATNTPKTGGKPVVPADSFESTDTVSGENSNLVTYTMEFEVVADDTVVYIPKTAARSGSGAGVIFQVSFGSTTAPKGTVSSTLTSTADEESGYYEIEEGTTETFTTTVTFDPTVTGQYRAELLRLNWTDTLTIGSDGGVTAGKIKSLKFTPAEDFRSNFVVVNGS